ncbi:MAG: methyltransferase domain-containing protein [Candidatus Omnitrophica bacterium]|nr:methyltransferase domain-containing protein [Candidatus Omnitrophota bacterium]
MALIQELLLVANKLLSRKRNADIYREDFDSCAQTYDATVTRHLLGTITEGLIKELNLKPGMRCIDLGCGTGHATEIIDRLIQPNGSVIGYDVSEPMLEIARRKLGTSSVTKFIKGDMLTALRKHQDDSVDLITAFWAIGYSQPEKVLKEIRRVLVKNGHIAILVNTQSSLYELQRLVTKILFRHPFVLRYIPPIDFPSGINVFKRIIERLELSINVLSEQFCVQSFSSGASLISWMKTGGPCAGFRRALRDDRREYVFNKIQEAVKRKGGIKLTFRFIRYIGTK